MPVFLTAALPVLSVERAEQLFGECFVDGWTDGWKGNWAVE